MSTLPVAPETHTMATDISREASTGAASRSSSTIIDENDRQYPDNQDDVEDINSEFHREAYGPEPGEDGWDKYEVRFEPDDPEHPQNWSALKKWYLTMFSGLLVLNATFASSIPTGIVPELMMKFTFSQEVGALMISLFVAGYCVGPILWGPISEQYGRRIPFIVSFFAYTCFQVGCALSPNTASILIFRFLGGTFAAAPLTNSGGVISDIWDAKGRGTALAFFTLAPFAGPSLGPTVGGFMSVAGVSWRWVFWLLTFFAGACLAGIIFTLPETYVPVLLVNKAKRLRKETGDDRYWAPLEKKRLSAVQTMEAVLARPFKILFLEPMLLAITLYMSFIYGCMYLLFEAYPIVFSIGHGLNAGLSGLTFLPIFIGGAIGCAIYIVYWNPLYARLVDEYKPHPVPPEYRLDLCLWAAPGFAASFFWFGWTSYPSISLWAPMMSGALMGFCIVWIFMGLFTYIIDAYLFVAASALASTTVIRSLFGAGFPLFANQMYETLNPRWASTLLGCIAVLMAPIPFILKRYGHHLRRKSKFAPKINVQKAAPPKDEKTATNV
ncbi:MFS general substrate transporter [Panus rudis PR-1116 ss-1]|nr:MFS general substrate transporter [Panus rudis PR-1116 ss-1]